MESGEAGRFDRGPDPLGGGHGAGDGRARQHDGKLFAAVTSDQVDVANLLGEDHRQLPQHHIAGRVPVTVVEPLEMIDVDQHQGEDPAEAAELGGPPGQLAIEGAAVGQPGQGIGRGLLGLQFQELRLLAHAGLGQVEPLAHLPVVVQDLRHRGQHGERLGILDLGQPLADLLQLRAVGVDLLGRGEHHLVELGEELAAPPGTQAADPDTLNGPAPNQPAGAQSDPSHRHSK